MLDLNQTVKDLNNERDRIDAGIAAFQRFAAREGWEIPGRPPGYVRGARGSRRTRRPAKSG
jgi:hypothetical protein